MEKIFLRTTGYRIGHMSAPKSGLTDLAGSMLVLSLVLKKYTSKALIKDLDSWVLEILVLRV